MTARPLTPRPANVGVIRGLTFLMFLMFAMTTDSVGVIIPEVIKTFHLGMAVAGAFHYASMTGIALGGVGLGFLADRLGRKGSIILGLSVFAVSAFGFALGDSFTVFLALLFVAGMAIGVFKTGALALIGDISTSTRDHTATMNLVEGFFGVGAIIGPAIVAALLSVGASWKWLYVIAAVLCVLLIVTALRVPYPRRAPTVAPPRVALGAALRLLAAPYALSFSVLIMLYVGVETAIYVWMPTFLADYRGPAVVVAAYALSIFFVLRAAGRFLGSWMLGRFPWTAVMALCSGAIFACFAAALFGGKTVAVFALPFSGLFMSVIYPTLNSKGISGFPKAEHGAVAGVILFFTCISAVVSPLAMGAVSDRFGDPRYGFILATGLAALLFAALTANFVIDPSRAALDRREDGDYPA